MKINPTWSTGGWGVALKPQVKYVAGRLDVAVRNTLRKNVVKVSNFGKKSQENFYVSSDMSVLSPLSRRLVVLARGTAGDHGDRSPRAAAAAPLRVSCINCFLNNGTMINSGDLGSSRDRPPPPTLLDIDRSLSYRLMSSWPVTRYCHC